MELSNNDYEIISIDLSPATNPGENFMAFLFRSKLEILIKASGDKKTLTYIVKCLLNIVYNEQMVYGYEAFPKEKKIYKEILPAFEKLYEDVGEKVTFGPKLFYSTEHPTDIIVLEYLEDYKMLPKIEGLDIVHVKCGLTWLAQFHAASMVYYELNGPYGDQFKEGVFAKAMEPVYQSYYDNYFDNYITALKELKNGERYAEKAEKWRGQLFNLMVKSIEFDEHSPVNVLCHGDMWSNNLMFKYAEDGSIEDLKTVDYQLLFYGTPAKDLFNFMITSWRTDIKVKEFVNLIAFYHQQLSENLKLLKYQKPIPTLKQLNDELFKRKFLMAGMTVELLPFPLNDVPIAQYDEWLKALYDNPRCRAIFQVIFPWLDARTALELP